MYFLLVKLVFAFNGTKLRKNFDICKNLCKKIIIFFVYLQKLLFSHIFRHHLYELFCRFIHVTEELSARGIHVPSAAEHFPGKDIYRSVTLAAEGDLGFDLCIACFGLLVRRNLVLAHKDGVIYVFDLQRHIHYALHVARFGVEAVHLSPVERDECGVVLGKNFHLMVQAVANHPQSVRRIGVEHAVVDGVLVDTCCQQPVSVIIPV